MLTIFLLSAARSDCSVTLEASIGTHRIHLPISPNSSICLNTSYYPFYIAFYNISRAVTYYEYYSRSPARLNASDHVFPGDKLPVVRGFDLPYGSIAFASTEATAISFTYMAMPGMCHTGLYFSTKAGDAIRMDPHAQGFDRLSNYEDKCFLFAVPAVQQIAISLRAEDAKDIVYVYSDFFNYTAHASETLDFSIVSDYNPPLVRLVTSRATPPLEFSVSLNTSVPGGYGASSVVIPRHKEVPCEQISHWYSPELVITLITVSAFLLVASATVLFCRLSRNREAQLSPNDSGLHTLVESH
jgi:hypothetical protein